MRSLVCSLTASLFAAGLIAHPATAQNRRLNLYQNYQAAPQGYRGQVVDFEAALRAADAYAKGATDKYICIKENQAVLVRAGVPTLPASSDRGERVATDPALFQALARGQLCGVQAVREGRAAVPVIMARPIVGGDYGPTGRDIDAIRRPARTEDDDVRQLNFLLDDLRSTSLWRTKYGRQTATYDSRNSFPKAVKPSDAFAPYIYDPGQDRPVLENRLVSAIFDQQNPTWKAFFDRLVDHIDKTNDPATLQRLADQILPFVNIYMDGNATSFILADQKGAGRDDIARGQDPLTKARSDPSAGTVTWLLVAKADPVSSVAMARNRQPPAPRAGPSAYEVALMYADAFYRGNDKLEGMKRVGGLTQGGYGAYGAQVVYSLDAAVPSLRGVMPEGFSTYRESLSFLVNDLPGPTCIAQRKGYSCRFQIYIDQDEDSLFSTLGLAARSILLEDKTVRTPEERRRKLEDNIGRRNFPWWTESVLIEKVGGAWRSTIVDAKMAALANFYENARLQKARAWQAGINGFNDARSKNSMCNSLGAGVIARGGAMNNSVGRAYRTWC